MQPHATSSRWVLAVLCLASAGWAFSFGLGAALASRWMHDAGCSGTLVGLNTSFYYAGVALASLAAPALMRRSPRACVVGGMALDALAVALFPWCAGAVPWLVLRFLAGVGTAVSLIPMETLVNHNAPDGRRARDFGTYAVCVALGVGLGPTLGLPLYPVAPTLAFAIGGAVTLLAALFVAWQWPRRPLLPEAGDPPAPLPLVAQRFSLGTAWVQGFLEGGMMTFLAVYLGTLGYTEGGASGLLAVLFAGVVLAQLPVAWLADRLGRVRVTLGCHFVVLAGLCLLPWLAGPVPLGGVLFAVGACCAALYPLGLAVLGERVPPAAMGRANAWYLASNCAGSLTGPLVLGALVDAFAWPALFAGGAAAVAGVLLLGIRRGTRPSGAAAAERKAA